MNIKQLDYLRSLGYSNNEAIDIFSNSTRMTAWGYSHKIDGELVNKLGNLLGIADKKKRVGFILYWLMRSDRSNSWLRVPKSKQWYEGRSSVSGISYDLLVTKVIDKLVSLDMIDVIPGSHYHQLQTLIKPNRNFSFLFDIRLDNKALLLNQQIHNDSFLPVVLRNKSKKIIKVSQGNRILKKMSKDLSLINKTNSSSSITLSYSLLLLSPSLEGNTTNDEEQTQSISGLKADEKMSSLIGENNTINHLFYYTRMFNERKSNKTLFEAGGRFYSRGSNLPKRVRDEIMIDGEKTVELDFSCYHPTMIAAMCSETLSVDPYSLPYDLVDSWGRADHKKAVNGIINCSSKKAANGFLQSLGIKKPSRYIAAVLNLTPYLKDFIGTDAGVRLQKTDSDIANRIMIEFINTTGSAILCWHDSFRVQEKYEDLLKDIMKRTFRETFNTNIEVHNV